MLYYIHTNQPHRMSSFADYVDSKPAADEAQAEILRYCEVLCEALMLDYQRQTTNGKYSFIVETARKYHKVIMITTSGDRSIHAFVDVKTGDVLKPASWKAPAKGIRYNLLDPISRENMLSRAGWCNHYLYAN